MDIFLFSLTTIQLTAWVVNPLLIVFEENISGIRIYRLIPVKGVYMLWLLSQLYILKLKRWEKNILYSRLIERNTDSFLRILKLSSLNILAEYLMCLNIIIRIRHMMMILRRKNLLSYLLLKISLLNDLYTSYFFSFFTI